MSRGHTLSERRVVNFMMDPTSKIICASKNANGSTMFLCDLASQNKINGSCFSLIPNEKINWRSGENKIWLGEVSYDGEPFIVDSQHSLSPALVIDEIEAIQMDLIISDDGDCLSIETPDSIPDDRKNIIILNTTGKNWKIFGKDGELRSFLSPISVLKNQLKNELNIREIGNVYTIIKERSISIFGSPTSVNDIVGKFLSSCKNDSLKSLDEFQIMVVGEESDVAIGILNELKFKVVDAEKVQYSILSGLAKALIVKITMLTESAN